MTLNDNRQSTESDLKLRIRTAFHEAGHAAAAFAVGKCSCIKSISIEKDAESCGRVVLFCEDKKFIPLSQVPYSPALLSRGSAYPKAARNAKLYCMAGPLAEMKLRGVSDIDEVLSLIKSEDEGSDYRLTIQLGFPASAKQTVAFIKREIARARKVVDKPRVWDTIKALADELLKRDILEGEDACEIMRKAWEEA
jgi:hypothetical protein